MEEVFLPVRFGYHLDDFWVSQPLLPPALSFVLRPSFISARRNVEDNAEQYCLTDYDSIFRATRFQLDSTYHPLLTQGPW